MGRADPHAERPGRGPAGQPRALPDLPGHPGLRARGHPQPGSGARPAAAAYLPADQELAGAVRRAGHRGRRTDRARRLPGRRRMAPALRAGRHRVGSDPRDDDRRRRHLCPRHPAPARRGAPGRRRGHPLDGRAAARLPATRAVRDPDGVPDGVRPRRAAVPRGHPVHHRRVPDGLDLLRRADVVRSRWRARRGAPLPRRARHPLREHCGAARCSRGPVPPVPASRDPGRAGRSWWPHPSAGRSRSA